MAKKISKTGRGAEAPPTLSGPVGYLTPAQWRSQPSLQAALRKILADPTFQMAFQTLLVSGAPSAATAEHAVQGVSAEAMDKNLAYRYMHRSGFNGYPNALANLARAVTTAKQSAEFGELLPELE